MFNHALNRMGISFSVAGSARSVRIQPSLSIDLPEATLICLNNPSKVNAGSPPDPTCSLSADLHVAPRGTCVVSMSTETLFNGRSHRSPWLSAALPPAYSSRSPLHALQSCITFCAHSDSATFPATSEPLPFCFSPRIVMYESMPQTLWYTLMYKLPLRTWPLLR